MSEWQIIQMLISTAVIPLLGLVYRNLNEHQKRNNESIESALVAQTSSLRTILDGHRAELTGLGGRVSHLESTLGEMRVALAQHYITKSEHNSVMDEIKRLVKEVHDLAREMDKSQGSFSSKLSDCRERCQQGKGNV